MGPRDVKITNANWVNTLAPVVKITESVESDIPYSLKLKLCVEVDNINTQFIYGIKWRVTTNVKAKNHFSYAFSDSKQLACHLPFTTTSGSTLVRQAFSGGGLFTVQIESDAKGICTESLVWTQDLGQLLQTSLRAESLVAEGFAVIGAGSSRGPRRIAVLCALGASGGQGGAAISMLGLHPQGPPALLVSHRLAGTHFLQTSSPFAIPPSSPLHASPVQPEEMGMLSSFNAYKQCGETQIYI